ncbi:hypothetical protein JTB14_010123 [Gonioctena quinquepunctata]|nr:hypothetical protein JTB14_010123 [Gonioctena quinquepunctata]
MSSTCCKCNNNINFDNEIYKLTCDSCGGYLHEKCSGLSATELRCIPLKTRTLMLLCEGCRGSLKSIPKMLKVMDEMQSLLAAMYKEIKEAKGKRVIVEDDEGVLSEVEDRITRSKNVIFYNIHESPSTTIGDKVKDDSKKVNDLLGNCQLDYHISKIIRLGKISTPGKPRPLKVVFNDSETAKQVLRSRKQIDRNDIKIANYLTVKQRDHLKSLRSELSDRQSKGKADLTIKYIRGVPKIVE